MTSAVELAIDTYIRAASERDPTRRAALLEQCFAEDGRLVTSGREIRGREALSKMFERFWSDPETVCVRVTSAIDAGATIFRYRAVTERRDGTSLEVFDAGEINAEGRISLILTFAGPLPDADHT
jgi:hypothetical protein